MSVLRVRCPLRQPAPECGWVALDGGAGTFDDLPERAARVEVVLPAADVLITRTALPPNARRRAGATLAYAVEEATLGEPEAQRVTWLGRRGEEDVLAVVDGAALSRWLERLQPIGPCAVYCETLMLPFSDGEWSLGWDGREGFVRTGELEACATDAGDRDTPPLALRLMLDEAAARDTLPERIAIYCSNAEAEPEMGTWQAALGLPLRNAGTWDWRIASLTGAPTLLESKAGWHALSRLAPKLRPAAWIAAAALMLHAGALLTDWALLASEQHALSARMTARFRTVFPDAVAVVDPALQMRRKLAEARHAADQPDEADFLPMIARVAEASGALQPGALRLVTYDAGRLTLQFASADEPSMRRVASQLRETGLHVEASGRAIVVTGGGT